MIRSRSTKRAKQEREYAKLRKAFLEENPYCVVCVEIALENDGGVWNTATQVHHQRGRIGNLLTDTRYFLGVCDTHHMQIELGPVWAKEKGYSISRLSKS